MRSTVSRARRCDDGASGWSPESMASEIDGDGAGARSWRAPSKGALPAVLTGWRERGVHLRPALTVAACDRSGVALASQPWPADDAACEPSNAPTGPRTGRLRPPWPLVGQLEAD